MLFCYSRMCFTLSRTQILGNYSDALARAQKDKQKVVKMFVFVIVLFGICWLPYNVYFIYIFHDNTIIKLPFIKHVYLFLYWLAMANASINPLIYYTMNKRFELQSYIIHDLCFNLYRFHKHFNHAFRLIFCGFVKISSEPNTSNETVIFKSFKLTAISRAFVTWDMRHQEHSEGDASNIVMLERNLSSRKEVQNIPVFI
jgi:hypothetical protein